MTPFDWKRCLIQALFLAFAMSTVVSIVLLRNQLPG